MIGVIILGYRDKIPLWEKSNLTLEEAAAYSGIGINKLRTLSDDENCPFVLWVGNKRLLKRKKLDEFLDGSYSV
jgi:excisionase family DNA binding protein